MPRPRIATICRPRRSGCADGRWPRRGCRARRACRNCARRTRLMPRRAAACRIVMVGTLNSESINVPSRADDRAIEPARVLVPEASSSSACARLRTADSATPWRKNCTRHPIRRGCSLPAVIQIGVAVRIEIVAEIQHRFGQPAALMRINGSSNRPIRPFPSRKGMASNW